MASIINAATSGGLISTGDTSGQLQLQTAGTTALTISSAQAISLTNALPIASGGTGSTTLAGANIATTNSSTQSINSANTFGFKNRIINGAMVIDQRNAGAAVATPTSGSYQFILDRYSYAVNTTGKVTFQQASATPAPSFGNYLAITCSGVVSSYAAGDYYYFTQPIEGYNTYDLMYGTSSAKTTTLSFWTYSNLTGTFGGAFINNATNRSYPFTYTISSANTWAQVSITVPGDTTGTWVGNTNGCGLRVCWGLGVGSTYSGTAGSWSSNYYVTASGITTNLLSSTSNYLYITGVQLEVGTQATSFDFRDYGRELMLCQRYFEKNAAQGTAPQQGLGPSGQVYGGGLTAYSTTYARAPRIRFAVVKRTAPSITFYRSSVAQGGTVDGQFSWYNGSAWLSSTSTVLIDSTTQDNEFGVELASSSSYTGGYSYLWGGTWTASAEL